MTKCSDVLEKFSAIIPGRAVSDIGKLLSGDENAFANLSFGGGKLHIGLDRTDILRAFSSRGEYVNYRQILPKSFRDEGRDGSGTVPPLRRPRVS